MASMRTTVTLDPDVAEQLRTLARQRNVPFKVALNNAIRTGLAAERGGSRRYRVPARSMGLQPGADLTHAARIAEALEDDEIVRKLAVRK
jgi:hypothetical protein